MLKCIASCVITTLFSLVLASLSLADTFECKCGNGTTCKVNCACSGSASCGHDTCSTECASCDKQPAVAIPAIAESLFATSFIAAQGKYESSELVADLAALFSVKPGTDDFSESKTAKGVFLTLKAKSTNPQLVQQVIHVPEEAYASLKDDQAIATTLETMLQPKFEEWKSANFPSYLLQ
jgi:hypothetical protein